MIIETPQKETIGGEEGFKSGSSSMEEAITREQMALLTEIAKSCNGGDIASGVGGGSGGGGGSGNGGGGGSSSSPFPRGLRVPAFLTKIYEMVDDPKTDALISWGSDGTSFIVWDHHIFSREILPKFFRHDNFSSFIYQLNNYGFKKIDWDHWEYENKWFQKGNQHLLVNIKRKNQLIQVTDKNRAKRPSVYPGNFVFGPQSEKQRNDQNQLKMELLKLVKKQEAMENDLVSVKNQIESLFKQQKMVIYLASAFVPKYAQQFKQHLEKEGEVDNGETAKKRKVAPESTETPKEDTDIPDNSSKDMEGNSQVQLESGNNAVSGTTNVKSSNSENCLMLEKLMAVDENEVQVDELAEQQSKIVIELEDLIGTPADWGYMKDFMHQVDFQESKPVILLE